LAFFDKVKIIEKFCKIFENYLLKLSRYFANIIENSFAEFFEKLLCQIFRKILLFENIRFIENFRVFRELQILSRSCNLSRNFNFFSRTSEIFENFRTYRELHSFSRSSDIIENLGFIEKYNIFENFWLIFDDQTSNGHNF
jgi:hypothetical protein